ncbi:MAG: filamentous hemagglutinin N-terminal domain-containing protein, partial [Alphaproteobacteria bacterium]|nr:filamentous hemagglutinin N-terminal domain-containing protein [Alphaproteobacteria bacterium]
MSLLPAASRAAPLGGQIATGSATISASGLVTTINQSTDRAVIDWSSFNLSQNESAEFIVPSSTAATLNRISGGISTISGTVRSNGTVYFSNPNGMVFDATSRVTANGFFATTGQSSNFDFMNRGEFSNLGNQAVTLNGSISAPSITARAGTVTVGGALEAGSGKILLSSTNLTTIGQGATISTDGSAALAGGNIKIWSYNHTDFLGRITANSAGGDGGFVEVSGKKTLNFSGTVSTLAPHGKTGTLLLDPATVEIVTTNGTDATVSYITTANLIAALGTNDVVIDATSTAITSVSHTSGTGVGGSITVVDPLSWGGSGNLTLTAGAGGIAIKAAVTSTNSTRRNLSLNSVGRIRADSAVLTVGALTATASQGQIFLNGANAIATLGSLTAGAGDITVRNSAALSVAAGASWSAPNGVTVILGGGDLTLNGATSVAGKYLRLDLGGGAMLGGQSLTANGVAVFYTSALAGN